MTSIHILGGFLDFLRELQPTRELSPVFDVQRATDAHALLKRVATELDAQPDVNKADNPLFPRVAMADREDVRMLAESMAETASGIKSDLVTLTGKYAMGNEELALSDLEELAARYITACRLTTALMVHLRDKIHAEHKQRQANEKAAAAYKTMDESAGFTGTVSFAHVCTRCGQPAIREHLASGTWLCASCEV